MTWEINEYSIPLWIAAFVSAVLAHYAWRFRSYVGATPFALLMLAVSGLPWQRKKYRHPEEILRDADVAMYWSKEQGRGRYKVFAPDRNG